MLKRVKQGIRYLPKSKKKRIKKKLKIRRKINNFNIHTRKT